MRRTKRKLGNEAALDVLANRSLLVSIAAFASGISYSAHTIKQQLVCAGDAYSDGAVPPEDVTLWQNAISAGDRATLNAFLELSQARVLGKRLVTVLSGILSYAVVHTRDFELLDWIETNFERFSDNRLETEAEHRAVGEQGDIAIVTWLLSRGLSLGDGAAYGAASRGHLDLIKFLHGSEEFEIECKEALIRAAAENGYLDVIAFVLDNVLNCSHSIYRDEEDDAMDFVADDDTAINNDAMENEPENRHEGFARRNHDAINFAAAIGALDAVRLLHERRRASVCSTSAMDGSAANGHLSVVTFLHENRDEGCTAKAMDAAAANGQLGVLRYLHENRQEGCTSKAMDCAATNGHFEIVKFLHENRQEGCTTMAMDGAATQGYLEIVQYLHKSREEGCTTKAMDGAASNGHLDIVRFLHENRQEGCTGDTIDDAAKKKHFDIVRFLHTDRKLGCRREAILSAIKENDGELFKCVCENRGEDALKGALKLAVECGNLQFVKYLLELSSDGVEWSFWLKAYLVNVAATKGFLDLIQFFHTHEFFQFTPTTMHNAAIGNYLEIVDFLHEKRAEGCRVDTLLECDARGLGRITEYLCMNRPMVNPERGIVRARLEGRLKLAALIKESARVAKKTYEYT